MQEPPPEAPPPGVPVPPPPVDRKKLWISIGLPPVVMALFLAILFVWGDAMEDEQGTAFVSILCLTVCLTTALGWGLYIMSVSRRFRGASLVILILTYPLAQSLLLFAMFFGGCWVFVMRNGVW